MPAPSAPTGFLVAAKAIPHFFGGAVSNKSALRFAWTNNALTAQHRLEKSPNNSTWSLAGIASPGTSSFVVGKLPNNDHWYFRVRSENGDGNSAWATLDLTTPALATVSVPPLAPSNLEVDALGSYFVDLVWADESSNEANFVVEVVNSRGVVRSQIADPMATSARLYLDFLFGGDPSDSFYTVRVKAVGGSAKASGFPPYSSAWSNEVTFRTDIKSIRITSPLAVTVEKGGPVSYVIAAEPTPTDYAADSNPGSPDEQLPDGLTRDGAVISGTITAAVGTYDIDLTVSDGLTEDTKTLVLMVVDPSILLEYRLNAPLRLGVPIQALVRPRASGIPGALTWSLPLGPSWLGINAASGALTGTPDAPGDSIAQVLVTNGTRNGSISISLSVPEFSMTSETDLTVFVEVAFSHPLTSSGAVGATYALEDGAPEWVSLTGATLAGTPPEVGVYEFDVTATAGIYSASQTIKLTVEPAITVAAEVSTEVGNLVFSPVILRPTGYNSVEWLTAGLPAGITLEDKDGVRVLMGTPTASGQFLVHLAALVDFDFYESDIPRFYRAEVTFYISGGAWLNWFHPNPGRTDLTCYLESHTLVSGRAKEGVLQLIRDDSFIFFVILREGPGFFEPLGDDWPIGDVRFMIRPKDDLDGEPLFEFGGTLGTADFAGRILPYIEIESLTSPVIEDRFTAPDATRGPETVNQKIEGIGEVQLMLDDGRRHTFRGLPVEILRDVQQ